MGHLCVRIQYAMVVSKQVLALPFTSSIEVWPTHTREREKRVDGGSEKVDYYFTHTYSNSLAGTRAGRKVFMQSVRYEVASSETRETERND